MATRRPERGSTGSPSGGYHAFVAVKPDNGANVVVLTNTGSDIDDIGLHLLDPSIPLR